MTSAKSRVRILVVEDDEKLSLQIERYLRKYDYDVMIERNGARATTLVSEVKPDIVILDLMLPGADGFEVCRAIRPGFKGSILMLTASVDDMDQVAGIEMGADGYLIKPIHPRVLLAHIRMLLRKQCSQESSDSAVGYLPVSAEGSLPSLVKDSGKPKSISFGKLNIRPVQRVVTLADQEISLTPSEFDVLKLLASHPEEIVSRNEILKALRNIEYDGLDRSVDVKVSALRKKLGDSTAQPRRIITVRAKGYLFVPDAW